MGKLSGHSEKEKLRSIGVLVPVFALVQIVRKQRKMKFEKHWRAPHPDHPDYR